MSFYIQWCARYLFVRVYTSVRIYQVFSAGMGGMSVNFACMQATLFCPAFMTLMLYQ